MPDLEVSLATSMRSINKAEWDSLASSSGWPLVSWGYLALLEESGSIRSETGWHALHILVRRKGKLVAAAPFYIKTHSWGEYVFDFGLAKAAENAGVPWYPKLVGAIPATPCPAWRVLTAVDENPEELEAMVINASEKLARKMGLSGVHILWPDAHTADSLARARDCAEGTWTRWAHQAFLWTDSGYGDFPGFLNSLSKNMRRNIRRERESIRSRGIETRILRAEEAKRRPRLLESMADLYEAHNARFGPWAAKFLTREFFTKLPEYLAEGWAIGAAFEPVSADGSDAEKQPEMLALSFLFEGHDRLYGRFWGARRDVPNLHFELCYYLTIEYALERGIGSFDPGMGSPHKARRGFRPIDAPSFHNIFDARLAALTKRALREASAAELAEIEELNRELPYKRCPGPVSGRR